MATNYNWYHKIFQLQKKPSIISGIKILITIQIIILCQRIEKVMKVKVISVRVRAFRTISKNTERRLGKLEIRGRLETLQTKIQLIPGRIPRVQENQWDLLSLHWRLPNCTDLETWKEYNYNKCTSKKLYEMYNINNLPNPTTLFYEENVFAECQDLLFRNCQW